MSEQQPYWTMWRGFWHGVMVIAIVFFFTMAAQSAFGNPLRVIGGSEDIITIDEQFMLRLGLVDGEMHVDINIVSSRNFMHNWNDLMLMPDSDVFNAPTYWYPLWVAHEDTHPALNTVFLGGVNAQTIPHYHSTGLESDDVSARHWHEEHRCDATRWMQLPGEYRLMDKGTDSCGPDGDQVPRNGLDNASIRVTFLGIDLDEAQGGTYTDTLTILVSSI